MLLQGGHHPDLGIEWYEGLLALHPRALPRRSTSTAFSPPEITFFAETWGMDRKEILRRFIAAGLGSIPGGGAEILVDRVRKSIAARKATTDEWLGVMEDAHGLGLKTSATMMFGHVETLAERIEHLVRLREVQDRTGGFTAFIGWTYQSPNTKLERGADDGRRARVPPHARRLAPDARQLPARPGLVGDPGPEDRAAVPRRSAPTTSAAR